MRALRLKASSRLLRHYLSHPISMQDHLHYHLDSRRRRPVWPLSARVGHRLRFRVLSPPRFLRKADRHLRRRLVASVGKALSTWPLRHRRDHHKLAKSTKTRQLSTKVITTPILGHQFPIRRPSKHMRATRVCRIIPCNHQSPTHHPRVFRHQSLRLRLRREQHLHRFPVSHHHRQRTSVVQ